MKLHTLTKLANEISTESLFSRGGTLHAEQIKSIFKKSWKYCTGKYSPTNKGKDFITSKPIWYVTRSDKDGSYLLFMNVDERLLTDEEKITYKRIVAIWMGV